MRIKELRQEKELTQNDIAKAINTSQRNISRWENGENEPSSSFIIKLANYFDVSADYLLGLEDDFGSCTAAPMGDGSYSSEEREIILKYRTLPEKLKKMIRDNLEVYSESNELLPKKDKKV